MSMQPIDRFGRKISYRIYSIMCEYGARLKSIGYIEATKKPNLFHRSIKLENKRSVVFFTDMRGTEMISIWEDPRPILFWNLDGVEFRWEQRRIILSEINLLEKIKCPTRFSYYQDAEGGGLAFGFSAAFKNDNITCSALGWRCYENCWDETDCGDGYCMVCGKDFSNRGLFCSEDCYKLLLKNKLKEHLNIVPVCSLCGKPIVDDTVKEDLDVLLPDADTTTRLHKHHLSYKENRTIIVCASCHGKIHNRKEEEYLKYRPVDKKKDLSGS